MVNRIKEFIDNQGISVYALEQRIGCSEGTLRRAIKNNTDIQAKWITSICDNYPNLSIQWLVTGTGAMLNTNAHLGLTSQTSNENISTMNLWNMVVNLQNTVSKQQDIILGQQGTISAQQISLVNLTALLSKQIVAEQDTETEPARCADVG